MPESQYTKELLKELQSRPLWDKVQITQSRIIQWYNYWDGNVYVSFSGGKDSTVLLHLVRQIFPDVPAVYSNTGLEYPEIQAFVKKFDNVTILRPEMRFDEVMTEYGYPLISKETAEAIYYARRKVGKTPPPRKRAELQGLRTSTDAGSWASNLSDPGSDREVGAPWRSGRTPLEGDSQSAGRTARSAHGLQRGIQPQRADREKSWSPVQTETVYRGRTYHISG